jgi:hypothetical protein
LMIFMSTSSMLNFPPLAVTLHNGIDLYYFSTITTKVWFRTLRISLMAFHLLLFFGDLLATKLNEIDYKIYVVTALSRKKMMSTSKIKVKGRS